MANNKQMIKWMWGFLIANTVHNLMCGEGAVLLYYCMLMTTY